MNLVVDTYRGICREEFVAQSKILFGSVFWDPAVRSLDLFVAAAVCRVFPGHWWGGLGFANAAGFVGADAVCLRNLA